MEKNCNKCVRLSNCEMECMDSEVCAHSIFKKFRKMDGVMRRCMEKAFIKTGVYRGQHQVLMGLGFKPEQSQAEIAQKLSISPAAVANTLNKLEKGGYIRRNCSEEDKRINHVEMTEKGREAFKDTIRIFSKIESEAFSGFKQEELEQLDDYLSRISQNVNKIFKESDSKEEKKK